MATLSDAGVQLMLQAVCRDPYDMPARLALADALEEAGQTEEASWIRVNAPDRPAVAFREIRRHGRHLCNGVGRNGLVDRVELQARRFKQHAKFLVTHYPLTDVLLTDCRPFSSVPLAPPGNTDAPRQSCWALSDYSAASVNTRQVSYGCPPAYLYAYARSCTSGELLEVVSGRAPGLARCYCTAVAAYEALSAWALRYARDKAGFPPLESLPGYRPR